MKTSKYIIPFLVILFTIYSHLAYSKPYTIDSVPNPYDQLNVIYVVDPEQIIPEQDANVINKRLKQLEARTTIETVVVVLPSIGQEDTRVFANQLFNQWLIGKKDKDNGLLILLVIDQREVVFEVGYGLEGNLTDAKSYHLMDQYMLPSFKQNQFSVGLRIGTDGVSHYLEQQFYDGTLYSIGTNRSSLSIWAVVLIFLIVLIAIYCFFGDRIFVNTKFHEAKYVPPLFRGVGLLSIISIVLIYSPVVLIFTDISFHWLYISLLGFILLIISLVLAVMGYKIQKANKDKLLICPECRRRSLTKSEPQLDTLTDRDRYQHDIQSVSYYWFQCSRQKCNKIFHSDKVNSGWKVCSHCCTISMKFIKTEIIKEATDTIDGQKVKIFCCEKCAAEEKEILVIESKATKLRNRRSSRSSGGYSGRSGGGSSGGFRGGGRSGGGGARGRF